MRFGVKLLSWWWESVAAFYRAQVMSSKQGESSSEPGTRRQSIICHKEAQIEKREPLAEGDKSVEGEERQEGEISPYNGKYLFFNAVYLWRAVLRYLAAVV